jgi:hypothetical protein
MIGHWGVASEDNTIRIGRSTHNRTYIAGINGVTVDGTSVIIDAQGQLGSISSSQRYKDDIYDMAAASEALFQLRPVTFRYKQATESGGKPIQYGLIAEEVAEVLPEMVIYNNDGEPETVKYQFLAPMLLNELQKQKTEMEDQAARIDAMEQKIVALTALIERH